MKMDNAVHRNRKFAFQAASMASFIVWSVLPYSLEPIFSILSVVPFFLLLLGTSYQVYAQRVSGGVFSGTFREYASSHRVFYQNAILAIAMGTAALFIDLVRRIFIEEGTLLVLALINLAALSAIAFTFFRRPGIRKVLARSYPAGKEEASLLSETSRACGVRTPELRILRRNRRAVPNAFSWSIPGTRGYVFANEELFQVLNFEEAAGIFAHELGHITGKHSEKSFLFSSLSPLAWFDALVLSLAFIPWPFYLLGILALFGLVAYYILRLRGAMSRRYEKSADIFAGKNYDRDILISALKKLSEYTPYSQVDGRKFSSHDTLEERERLIRSL